MSKEAFYMQRLFNNQGSFQQAEIFPSARKFSTRKALHKFLGRKYFKSFLHFDIMSLRCK